VTQVTAPESGHVFHNRMSHSLKVAQIGRRNAQRLQAIGRAGHISGDALTMVKSLDPDAVEASCLAHDLGHPPFGHVAEATLHEVAQTHVGDDGGFEGNAQSFRIVTRLAQRAGGSGLDLTRQTLDGLLKYPWRWLREDALGKRERKWGYYVDDSAVFAFARRYYPPEDDGALPERSLEAMIMDWADDLTYAVHDLDDFYRAGLIPLHRLADEDDDEFKRLERLMRDTKAAAPRSWPSHTVDDLLAAVQGVAAGVGPTGSYQHTRAYRRDLRRVGSRLITRYLSAFTVEAAPDGVRVRIDKDIEREVEALKMLVRVYVVGRPSLAVVQHGQQRVIKELFGFYFDASEAGKKGDRRLFPPGVKEVLDSGSNDAGPRARVVVDMISGLTETAAIQLHRRLAGGWDAPALDATAHMA
jgi:dGTPase